MPYLDVSGTIDGSTLLLNVVNRHEDQADRDDDLASKTSRSQALLAITEVNGPDIKAENDFGKTEVRAESCTATANGTKRAVQFPAALLYAVARRARIAAAVRNVRA